MTNTPMTKEAFESWWGASKYTQVIYHKDSNHQIAKDAWQASEAQQASVIARLKRVIQGYEGEVSVNEKTIAELLEALESLVKSCETSNQRCLDQIGMGLIDLIMIQKAKQAIAKVKGK